MAIKKTFSLTLIFFLLVWALTAIDRIGAEGVRKASSSISKNLTFLTSDEVQFSLVNPTTQTQLDEIDRQLSELRAMKRGFEARALRHEDQAQRLQFEDRAMLETRRHLELADENRAKANRVQEDIDRLLNERRKLLQAG